MHNKLKATLRTSLKIDVEQCGSAAACLSLFKFPIAAQVKLNPKVAARKQSRAARASGGSHFFENKPSIPTMAESREEIKEQSMQPCHHELQRSTMANSLSLSDPSRSPLLQIELNKSKLSLKEFG